MGEKYEGIKAAIAAENAEEKRVQQVRVATAIFWRIAGGEDLKLNLQMPPPLPNPTFVSFHSSEHQVTVSTRNYLLFAVSKYKE